MAISDAQFAAWLLSDNADRCVLVEQDYQFESGSPPIPATGTLYYSNKVYFDGSGTHPYIDCVATLPQFSRSLGGSQFGTYSSSLGSIEIDNADGSQDSLLTLAIDGSAVRFYLGDVSWPPSDFRFIFSALQTKAVGPSFDRISIQLKDTGLLLNKSIGGEIKVGGTGPNADKWRKVNFGYVYQVECDALDPVTLTYIHSDTGVGLDARFTIIRDRGVPVVFTDNRDGTFTLAQTPAGTITAQLLYADPAGLQYACVSDHLKFFVGTRAGLIARGLYYGPGPTAELHSVSDAPEQIAAYLDAGGQDYLLGVSIADKRNVIDLLADITDSGLCFWAIRRDGKFTFGRLRPNYIAGFSITPSVILTEDLIDEGSFHIDHLTPGYFQFQATMGKNWSIQTDLASSLSVYERAILLRSGYYVLQNTGVGTDYANAPELYNKTLIQSPLIETLLAGSNQPSVDSPRMQFWMEVRRAMSLPWLSVLSVTTSIYCYGVELGDPVTVKVPRFGYDAGVDFQVIGIDINLPSKVALKLLRRDPQQSSGRTTTPPEGTPYSGAAKLFIATASFIAGEATGTALGTAATAPIANMTVTASFIPGTASAINASPPGAGPGGSSVTSITATTPIVVTPSPIVATGVVSHATSGVTAAVYGSAALVPQVTVNATGHVTAVTEVAISGGPPFSSAVVTEWYGDGNDGSFTLDGTATPAWATRSGSVYTMTRNCYMVDLTINSGKTLFTTGFQVFGNGTLTGADATSLIHNNGANANAQVGASNPGGGPYPIGQSGGDGFATGGSSISGQSNSVGGNGGNAGAGTSGSPGTGATQSAPTAIRGSLHGASIITAGYLGSSVVGGILLYNYGGGGAGANGDATNAGGGGAAGAGGVGIFFAHFAGAGTISANGGTGGARTVGNTGGGGGGGGGCIWILTATLTLASIWTITVTGGTGGAGHGSGANGVAGTAGNKFLFLVG